jgi:hypothetical protein
VFGAESSGRPFQSFPDDTVIRNILRKGLQERLQAPSCRYIHRLTRRYLIDSGLNKSDKSVALLASPNQE